MCVSFYLHLSKYFDSDHLCYIYLASFTSPARLIPIESILSSIRITVQAWAKDLYKTNMTFALCYFVLKSLIVVEN